MPASYLVEADGGSRGNPGPAAYGAVIMDAATKQVIAQTAEFLGIATNNVAEYRGLLAGLMIVAELDPGASILVRLDSKLVVEQMSGNWKIKKPELLKIAIDARKAFEPAQVVYQWIPRERNVAADALVNECLDAAAAGFESRIDRRFGPLGLVGQPGVDAVGDHPPE